MSDLATVRLLSSLHVAETPPLFLSSFFRSPEENYHRTEHVELDIVRDGQSISVPLSGGVQSLASRGNRLTRARYTSKRFTPPVFSDEFEIAALSTLSRVPGANPFEDIDFLRAAGVQARGALNEMGKRIRRAVELMAAQVFSNGTIALIGSDGYTLYELDFGMKASHRATADVDWDEQGANPLKDIDETAALVRTDGLREVTDLVFGASALEWFLSDEAVQAALDKTKLNLGKLEPAKRRGATQLGVIWIGSYLYRIWSYTATYEHPQTGALTPYVAPTHVLFLSEEARYDLTWGAIPRFETRSAPFLNTRLSSPGAQIDLHVASWISEDGKQLVLEVGARPLTIPSEIDSFARLETKAT